MKFVSFSGKNYGKFLQAVAVSNSELSYGEKHNTYLFIHLLLFGDLFAEFSGMVVAI